MMKHVEMYLILLHALLYLVLVLQDHRMWVMTEELSLVLDIISSRNHRHSVKSLLSQMFVMTFLLNVVSLVEEVHLFELVHHELVMMAG